MELQKENLLQKASIAFYRNLYMKYFTLISLFLLLNRLAFSQNSLEFANRYHCLQGIWQGERQTKEPFTDITEEFLIFKDGKLLRLYTKNLEYSIFKYYFQSIGKTPDKININLDSTISADVLDVKAKEIDFNNFFYAQISEENLQKNLIRYSIWQFLSCNAAELYYFYDEYKRLDTLPNKAMKQLVALSKKDNRDYLKEFLGLKVAKVIKSKAVIYSLPEKATKMYLVKEDYIEIIEQRNNWIKIKYYGGKTIVGWVKAEDVSI